MYRHQEQLTFEEDQFVNRIYNLPVMTAAIDQLNALYTRTKERNRLLRFTMETAELGLSIAVSTAKPVVAKFEKQITVLNDMACEQLDVLEQSYPIITKPADEVMKQTKDRCSLALKPITSRVTSVKQYGVDTVTNARDYTTETITSVKSYGMGKVMAATEVGTKQVTRALNTPVGHGVMTQMEVALDLANRYVDRYLPDATDLEPEFQMKEESESKEALVLGKACNLGCKVRRRVYVSVAGRMRSVQKRSKDTLDRLNFTVDLIQHARDNLAGAKEHVGYIWTEVNKSDEQVSEEISEESPTARFQKPPTTGIQLFELKAIATARHLIQKLKSLADLLSFTTRPASLISQTIHKRVDNILEMTHTLSDIFSKQAVSLTGLPQSALDNTRIVTEQIQQSVNWIVDYGLTSRPASYLTPTLSRFMTLPISKKPESETEAVDRLLEPLRHGDGETREAEEIDPSGSEHFYSDPEQDAHDRKNDQSTD